tara:strand:- start:262 stop:489 length:228 start_codon:yes stop_codon:yes gene_type:complete
MQNVFKILRVNGLLQPSNAPEKTDTENEESMVDTKVNIHTLYKHRWVWYHLILCIQLIISNILLIAILAILAIKL